MSRLAVLFILGIVAATPGVAPAVVLAPRHVDGLCPHVGYCAQCPHCRVGKKKRALPINRTGWLPWGSLPPVPR